MTEMVILVLQPSNEASHCAQNAEAKYIQGIPFSGLRTHVAGVVSCKCKTFATIYGDIFLTDLTLTRATTLQCM
jgi:hypothetical protein